jgi:hypothetical protein
MYGEEMRDLTCIYYTHNKERPEFEARIQRFLLHQLKKTGVHLISVSQKPMDFGHNICVGDVGISGNNTWRQFQIGVEAAKTKYVCTAESDYLHPREYFEFECPTDDTMYIMHPLWVLFAQKGGRYMFAPKHESSEAIMHGGRDFILRILDSMYNQRYDKSEHWTKGDKKRNLPYLFKQGKCEHITLNYPLITFKTDEAMHRKTRTSLRLKTDVLEPWGSAIGLIRKFCK